MLHNNDASWIGKRFGRLTVVGFRRIDTGGGKQYAWGWDCRCDCGKVVYGLRPRAVKNGGTRSCGCLKEEQNIHNLGEKRRTHGKTNTRLYGIWSHIKERCNNPNCPAYMNYGGRGIKLCDEWKDFSVFYTWSLQNGYDDGLTIERVDVNGGYCPENCCWVPFEEQAKNKRNIRYVDLDGEKMPLKTACERLGLPYKAIHLRITRYGMTPKEAITTPFKDMKTSLAEKCRRAGLPYSTVFARIKSGWDEQRALSVPVRTMKRQ